ncbi:unnamed protein product [Closterium sp. Yama58-4]|nr:unnamed protein product [Closterium sp. Yama58-4]
MDVWGPARVQGQGRERYFLVVVDDYLRYTTVFPLRTKGEVPAVLIPWIRAVRLQLRERFRTDLPVLRLHSDRGGEFSSGLLGSFCEAEGIHQSFTLPASPQQNGIAERCIGLVMERPRLHIVGRDASAFRVWDSFAFVRDSIARKLSSRAIPYVFLGFPPDAPGWQFYHPTSHRVFTSQDVTFDESVPFYRLFPYRTAPLPPAATLPRSRSPSGRPPPPSGSCSFRPWGAEPEGAASGGAVPGGAGSTGGLPGASLQRSPQREPLSPQKLRKWLAHRTHLRRSATGAGGTGAGGAGGAGAANAGAGGTSARYTRAGGTGAGGTGAGGTGAGGARAGGTDAGELEALELEALTLEALELETLELEALELETLALEALALVTLELVALELEALELEALELEALELEALSSSDCFSCRRRSYSPLPAPLPYTEQPESRTEPCEPASRLASRVRTVHRARLVTRPRPPPVPGTHTMALRPSSVPQRVPLPSPPASSLPVVLDPESDTIRAAHPTVTRLLATVVTDPSFESTAGSALVVEFVDFAAACRLDYAASLVAESKSVCPPSVGGECALGTDVIEDRQEDFECLAAVVPHLTAWLLADPDALDIPTPRSYAEAIAGPYSSQWQTAMDAEMASWKSTRTYVDAVPPPRANIVDGMWIFRVKRPSGSPPVFKARYVARGFSQRQGVDFFQTFSPTPKMTTLRVLLHVAAQRDYELHSLDFSTAFLQGSLHEEICLHRPPGGVNESFPAGTQWSLWRPVYGLRQAPREWHDILRTTLAALGFAPSTADPSQFLRNYTSLPLFYILVYVDDLVFATADTEALALVKSELQKRHTCYSLVTHGAAGPSALRLPVLLTTVHSSAYQSLALSSAFG